MRTKSRDLIEFQVNVQKRGAVELENVSKEKLVRMLERMWLIRHFEMRVMEVHSAGEFTGAAHPYIGEEAVAVGACAALEDTDYIAGNHRSHGHPWRKAAVSSERWLSFTGE